MTEKKASQNTEFTLEYKPYLYQNTRMKYTHHCNPVFPFLRLPFTPPLSSPSRCGPVAAGPGCKPVQDLSLPYPSCCPIISCPNADPDALKGEEYDEFTNWISEYYDNPTPTA